MQAILLLHVDVLMIRVHRVIDNVVDIVVLRRALLFALCLQLQLTANAIVAILIHLIGHVPAKACF